MGNLFHRSIDLFFSEVRARGMDFCAISDEKRRALVKECVSQVALEYRNTILKSSARNSYLERKVERIADRITAEVTSINRVVYEITKKPVATIEFE